MTNTLWVAANILFDLETGKTTQVLLLASREQDATTFTKKDAELYFNFVKSRARLINWSVERSSQRPETFVIKGTQDVV